jgi:hypothetical protein
MLALNIELSHLGLGDLDSRGVSAVVDLGPDVQSLPTGGGAMRLTMAARLTSGLPRQFMAMWEKSHDRRSWSL